jgi:hypothetical protein
MNEPPFENREGRTAPETQGNPEPAIFSRLLPEMNL